MCLVVVLEPGEFVGTGLSESAKHFVNVHGEYDFEVEYTSEISEDLARKMSQVPPMSPFGRVSVGLFHHHGSESESRHDRSLA